MLLYYMRPQSTYSARIPAPVSNRTALKFEPRHLLASWVVLGRLPASLGLHFFTSKMGVTMTTC